MGVQIYLEDPNFISFGYAPRNGIAGPRGGSSFTVVHQFTFPSAVYGVYFSHTLPAVVTFPVIAVLTGVR